MIRANALFVRGYLWRGARLWLGGRLLVCAPFILAGINPLGLPTSVSVEIVGLIVVLGWVEIWRRRERALLGNLGISAHVVSALFAAPAILGELVLQLLRTVVR